MTRADFSAINEAENAFEREALTFLYAYMPLSDLTGQTGQEHLMNVRATQLALKEMKWGSGLPETLVQQYVLPRRVHTEPLDSAKVLLYEQLKPMVRKLSMQEAAIKICQWCGRQVSLEAITQPETDRAHLASPMNVARNAIGNADEMAVLLVVALRSVAIPARLVYTALEGGSHEHPAWAEAWCDGEWLPLMPGMNEVARDELALVGNRCGLVLTHAFGPFGGEEGEEVIAVAPSRTLINVTEHYQSTQTLRIRVVDASDNCVSDAQVDLRSLGQFDDRFVTTLTTDSLGVLTLSTSPNLNAEGRPTQLLFWGYKEGAFGYAYVESGTEVTEGEEVKLRLDKKVGDPVSEEYGVDNSNCKEVDTLLYMARSSSSSPLFMPASQARDFVQLYRLPEETTAVDFITRSRANHAAVTGLMVRLRSEKSKRGGFDLLSRLNDEDLRSITLPQLLDHMQSTVKTERAELFYQYVRQPRISDEELSAYKKPLADFFSKQEIAAFVAHPEDLAVWVADNISVEEDCNVGATPITPMGVMTTRLADAHSRDILFVALARSFGLPTRIDRVTGRVQLMNEDDGMTDVHLDKGLAKEQRLTPVHTGWLSLTDRSQSVDQLAYGRNFTLYQVSPEGRLQRLCFSQADILQPFSDWHTLLQGVATLPAGSQYLLMTATPTDFRLRSLAIAPAVTTRVELF